MKPENGRRMHAERGFTLIEIMVVVVIIGLLVGIVAPGIMGQLGRAEVERARTDIESISTSLNMFRMDFFRYPTQEEGLEILLGGGEIDGRQVTRYLESEPVDPWRRPYFYSNPSEHGDRFDVYTLGADGEEGGDDENADLGTWNYK